MKKIIIAITIITFAFTSCESFLEENPRNQITLSQYFTTPEDAEASVNALYYSGVPTLYVDGSFEGSSMMMSGYMSGLFDNGRKESPGPIEAQNLTLDPVNLSVKLYNWWAGCYKAISDANVALKYIPTTESLSGTDANRLLAEAKFFRAWNYFFLLKTFGDVPLITEPVDNLDNIYVERTAARTVYDLIIEDLEWAIDNGGLNDAPFYLNGNRITKGVVETLLADVYLQMAGYPLQSDDKYVKAANVAKMVINSGKYQLIENGDDPQESAYNVMRTSDNEPEYIYAIEMNEDLRANGFSVYTIPTHSSPPGTKVGDFMWNGYEPLDEYVNIYDSQKDLRIQDKQLFHTKVEKDGETYEFNEWAPYIWYDEVAIFETGRNGQDMNVYRYAEILLIAAEAIAQTEGVTNEAVSYLADIKARAYWQTEKSQIISELNGLTKDQFIEEVWKERLRELPFNYKIWYDIQRTRKYPVANLSDKGKVDFVNVIGHTNPFGATFKEYHLLYPISETVMQRNPALQQNPGYVN